MNLDNLRHRLVAYRTLWRRYKTLWAHFWAQRDALTLPDLKREEAEFLPAALALQRAPSSPAGRWVARILMCLVLFLLLWSVLGKMDIIVNASGKIIPAERIKTIAAAETGRVDKLFVSEGQSVVAGEPLLELDTQMNDRERDKALGERDSARLQIARSRSLLAAIETNKPPVMADADVDGIAPARITDAHNHLHSQWLDYTSKRQRLDGEITRYRKELPLAAERARDYKALAQNHDVAKHAWLEKEQDKAEVEGKLADALNQRNALVSETSKNAEDALNEGLRLAAGADQDAGRATAHGDLLKLTAPVDGTVQQLTVHTIGGAVAAAQPLMVIVPKQSRVEIEAFIENKDIGFVQAGQSVEVKIQTFDYTKYGTITGRVSHVSRDAIDPNGHSAMDNLQNGKDAKPQAAEATGPVYSVKILLDQNSMMIDGREVALSPGMSASVEIKTGSRRVIEYFLSPLIQHGHESLNER